MEYPIVRITPYPDLYQKDRRPLRGSFQIYTVFYKIPLLNVLFLISYPLSIVFLFSCVRFNILNM